MLYTFGAAIVAGAVLVSSGSCAANEAPNHTVIQKRHFVDEQKKQHWVLDCRVGTTRAKDGKTMADVRSDEVSQSAYAATKVGSKC
jgi:hypothetical protein